MRPRARVLTVTALTVTTLGAAASAALADPSAQVAPATVAPGGTVTVTVVCEPTGASPPPTVQASSEAFARGTVTLHIVPVVPAAPGTAAAPAYTGTALVSADAGPFTSTVLGHCPAAVDGRGDGPGDGWAAVFTVSGTTAATAPRAAVLRAAAPRAAGAPAAAPAPADSFGGDLREADGFAADGIPFDEDPAGGASEPDAPAPGSEPLDPLLPESPADLLQDAQSAAPLGRERQNPSPSATTSRRPEPHPDASRDAEHGREPWGEYRTRPPTAEKGTHAGEGGAFTDSVPALIAGGVLVAGAVGASVHRLRRGASWRP